MNIVAHNVASKLFVGFVAVAMLLMLATPAKAATAEELQQMINQLLAQVASLQSQLGQGAAMPAGVCPYTWTRSLSSGSTGMDVMKLQQFLNADAETRVAASGVGSAGMETEYYGPATAAAVSKFQVKYRSDVLSPSGLVNPTGYFGPSSMAKANSLCVSAPVVVPPVTGDDTMGDDDDDSSSPSSLSGEASLKSFDIEDGDDVELEEGQNEESVMEFVIEFEDGDAMITRLDVNFDTDATLDDIWDVLGEVTLYVDGDEVASLDGSDEDEWRDGTSATDDSEGDLRFTGLDLVAEEDEELTVTLGLEIQDRLDDTSQIVTVDVVGMRFVDGDDVTTTEDAAGVNADANTFNVGEAGNEDELIVKNSTSDPDATTLVVEDDTIKSDWYTVFVFDLDTDDSVNDIELNTVAVTVTTGAADADNVVQDAEIVIDGVTYDDWDWNTLTGSTEMVLLFDIDGDHVIDAGDRVAAEVNLRFYGNNNGTQFAEGETIQASASTTLFDAEGVADVTATGGSTGEQHTLRSSGVAVDDFDSSESATVGAADDGSYGTFTLTFDVTAIGDDEVYVPLTATSSDGLASTTNGASYSVQLNGSDVASASADALSASLTRVSGGDTGTSGYVRLDSGDTATLRLTVTFNPGSTAGQYTVILNTVGFAATAVPATDTVDLSPATDYDSDPLYITS